MDYPNLVDSDELARRLAKEEAAGQCIRSRHGIVLFTEEGLVYMDGTNPDNDWELKYPIYENDCYYEMLILRICDLCTASVSGQRMEPG